MTQQSFNPSQQDTLAQSAHSPNLVKALNTLLDSVCAQTEWEYGESWIPDVTHRVLELSPAWCINRSLDMHRAVSWMQFQTCSKAFVLHAAEGMPGRVWQSQQPEWIEDVSARSETYFLRNQIARALGVKAGFGIPIVSSAQVLAVAVFFISKVRSSDPKMVARTEAIVQNFQYELSIEIDQAESQPR